MTQSVQQVIGISSEFGAKTFNRVAGKLDLSLPNFNEFNQLIFCLPKSFLIFFCKSLNRRIRLNRFQERISNKVMATWKARRVASMEVVGPSCHGF